MDGMELAVAEARKALVEGEVAVGAVLMRGDEVIWADHNRREQLHDPTAHAEMLCLRHGAEALGDWRLQDCTLYVTLEPCPMCSGAVINSRIKRLVYGAADKKAGCARSVTNLFDMPFNHKPEIVSGVLEEECASLLQDFFRELRKSKKKEKPKA